MWQTGDSVMQAGLFCGFSHCLKNARRRRKGSEEGDIPSDINTIGVDCKQCCLAVQRSLPAPDVLGFYEHIQQETNFHDKSKTFTGGTMQLSFALRTEGTV